MARESRQGSSASGGTLELLPLTLARPGEALARARAVLAKNPGPYDASVARQAVGIVLREFGDVSAGIRELRTALRLARLAGSLDRQADVLATLGVALIYAGRTKPGLSALDQAVSNAAGPAAGRALERRGIALWTVGQHPQALADLRRAVANKPEVLPDVLKMSLWMMRSTNDAPKHPTTITEPSVVSQLEDPEYISRMLNWYLPGRDHEAPVQRRILALLSELSGVEIKNLREIPPLVRKLTATKQLSPAAA